MSKGKLIASNLNNVSKRQHKVPCSDCPWRRDSLPGWLGGETVKDFVNMAHGEVQYNCHVIVNQQCAGMAVYRANVAKRCHDPKTLHLPKDKETVFATPFEFVEHHGE